MSALKSTTSLLAGRWQIPAALLGAACATATIVKLLPSHKPLDFQSAFSDIHVLSDGGRFFEATNSAADLLRVTPPLPEEQQARLHEFLADSIYKYEVDGPQHDPSNVRLILTHQDQAVRLGIPETTERHFRKARALEWLDQIPQALAAYREVASSPAAGEMARLANQSLARLLEDQPEFDGERRNALAVLVADESTPDPVLWWALQRMVQDALDTGDSDRAEQLLAEHGTRLKRSDLRGYHQYLDAWVKLSQGNLAQAEPLAHWVEEWIGAQAAGESPLQQNTDNLRAMNGWLLGEIHLAHATFDDALAAFDRAATFGPTGRTWAAITAARARALVALGRDSEAIEAYKKAIDLLEAEQNGQADQTPPVVDAFAVSPAIKSPLAPRIKDALLDLAASRQAAAQLDAAIEYRRLALRLIAKGESTDRLAQLEKLAQLHSDAAPPAPATTHCEYHRTSGTLFEAAAHEAAFNDPRYAVNLWLAAQQYQLAHAPTDAARVVQQFVESRSNDNRFPEALLMLARAKRGQGDYESAIAWCRRLKSEYPLLPEAGLARILMAECLLAAGPDRQAEAERILLDLLQDDHVTPQSIIFHDALATLAQLLYDQARYAEAIARLENLLIFFPDDPDRLHSEFLLADAYRKSAVTLRASAAAETDARRRLGAAAESERRFARAAERFEDFLHESADNAGVDSNEPDEIALYRRLARFYLADCLFDVNQPESLDRALAAYRHAAAEYERDPAALTAHVQIANIHLRRGQPAEAARALDRARSILSALPDAAFDSPLDASPGATRDTARGPGAPPDAKSARQAWQSYLAAVCASPLILNATNPVDR